MRISRSIPLALLVPMLTACSGAGTDIHTLYRNSVLDTTMRIHVATFDAADDAKGYNGENCNLAARLFSEQPGVTTRFWCEKGSYRR
jgi:hypothetical protein